MKSEIISILSLVALSVMISAPDTSYGESKNASYKKRIFVVDSYHREYTWAQDTNSGFTAGMLKQGYFDNEAQESEFNKKDYIETSTAIVKKAWMNTKRVRSKEKRAQITLDIIKLAKEFKPDIIFLGDDNAAKYVGNQFLDTKIPMVFWGLNNTPVKYGLVDKKEKPNHNVTGVYQSGYYVESVKLLTKIKPGMKTFAILSDDTTTGRSHTKKVQFFSRKGEIPLELVETVMTNNYELWQQKALELQGKVDAFFLSQYSGLKNKDGHYIPSEEVARWYVKNINIPEAAPLGVFVKEGVLCSANDSGYNQGFDAVFMGHEILTKGKDPATYPTKAPKRGALMANRERAKMLGISLSNEMGIEEYIEDIPALRTKY